MNKTKKVFKYFPITPRIAGMYMSESYSALEQSPNSKHFTLNQNSLIYALF